MSITDIIRAWKDEDDDEKNVKMPQNPAGQLELSDRDLEEVNGAWSPFDTAGIHYCGGTTYYPPACP